MDKWRLVKLVRDRVGRFNRAEGVRYKPIPEDRFIVELRAKLIEETAEYLADPSVDELADVLEVVKTLADKDLKVPMARVEVHAWGKAAERGGFSEGMGMFVLCDNDNSEFEGNKSETS